MTHPERLIAALTLLIGANLAVAEPFDAKFVDTPGQHIDLVVDGKPLIRHMYAFDDSDKQSHFRTYKPYTHVMDPSGEAPITKGVDGKFPHHRGIYIGWNRLGAGGKRYDLWHMKNTAQVQREIVKRDVADDRATLAVRIDWLDSDDKPLLHETRTLTVHPADDAHLLLDFTSELTAAEGRDIDLNGDPEHGGFQYRAHNDVAKNNSARYTFHEKDIAPKKDRDLPWVAMTYKLDDAVYTVQHMNHPDNPDDTVYSAYRNYGRFGAFFKQQIPAGQTLTLRYRIRITRGSAPAREQLAKHYQQFVSP